MHKFDDRPDIEPIWIHMNPRPWPLHHPLAPHPSPLSLSSAQGNLVENPFVSQRFFRRKISARCFGDLPELAARAARPTPKLHGTAQPSWSDDLKKITKQKMHELHVGHADVCMTWRAKKREVGRDWPWELWGFSDSSWGWLGRPVPIIEPKKPPWKSRPPEDAPGRSTHLHEGPHLLTSSSPKNKGCRGFHHLRATPKASTSQKSGHDLWRSLIMLWLKIGPQNGATIVTRMTGVAILKYLEMAALILSQLPSTSIYHTCHLPTTHGFSLVALRWGNRRAAFGSRMWSCDVWPSRTRINSRAKRFKESTSVAGWEIGHLQVCETGTNAFVACSKKMQTSMY